MFYNSLKKQALAEYDDALKCFLTTCDQVQQATDNLNRLRNSGVDLVNSISETINTITNIPREIDASLHEVAVSIKSFKPLEDFNKQAFNGYLEAAGEVMRGAGAAWFHLGTGDRFDKLWGWAIILLRTVVSGIKLSGTNAKIVNELRPMIKKIKEENTRLRIYQKKIVIDTTKISCLHDQLSDAMIRLSDYRNVNYVDLNFDEKSFLGQMVNDTKSLARLLVYDYSYEEKENAKRD